VLYHWATTPAPFFQLLVFKIFDSERNYTHFFWSMIISNSLTFKEKPEWIHWNALKRGKKAQKIKSEIKWTPSLASIIQAKLF
jgi:hypothetical protein